MGWDGEATWILIHAPFKPANVESPEGAKFDTFLKETGTVGTPFSIRGFICLDRRRYAGTTVGGRSHSFTNPTVMLVQWCKVAHK